LCENKIKTSVSIRLAGHLPVVNTNELDAARFGWGFIVDLFGCVGWENKNIFVFLSVFGILWSFHEFSHRETTLIPLGRKPNLF
jgi:hypothetical protein